MDEITSKTAPFRVGDQVTVPWLNEPGTVAHVNADCSRILVSFPDGSETFCNVHALKLVPQPTISLEETRELYDAIERAAAAAHDRFYEVDGSDVDKDLSYAYQTERIKRNWREVVIAVLQSASNR